MKERKKKIKKDIANAVANMQEKIVEEMGMAPPKTPAKNKTFLLWSGVIIISLAIFVVWILNTKLMWQQIKNNQSPEKNLMQNANQDLSSIMKDLVDQDTKDNLAAKKAQTEAAIGNALAILFTSSTTSTTDTASTNPPTSATTTAGEAAQQSNTTTTTENATNTLAL